MLECQLLNDGTSENFVAKLVAMERPLRDGEKRIRSIIYDQTPIIWWKDCKIGPVIIGLREIIKKHRQNV